MLRHENGQVNAALNELSRTNSKSTLSTSFSTYLAVKFGDRNNTVRNFFRDTMSQGRGEDINVNNQLHVPLFRYYKLKIKMFKNYLHHKLKLDLLQLANRAGCTGTPTLIIGNHSNPNMRYNEPAPGIQMRRRLRKMGFKMYLYDEFRSSITCSICNQRTIKKFAHVFRQRQYRITMARNQRDITNVANGTPEQIDKAVTCCFDRINTVESTICHGLVR
jgi:hypothetical protein